MEKNFYPVVEVFWKDHYGLGDDWYDEDEKHELRILSAVGYLVGENDDYLFIAANYDFGNETYSGGTAVLKNCIVKRRVVSKGKFDYDQFARKGKTSKARKSQLQPPKT